MSDGLSLVAGLAVIVSGALAPPNALDLLDGVREVAAPGVPGPLCVFGDEAFAVVLGGSGRGVFEPVVAAGRMGAGRVVAFGHTGYLDEAALDSGDTERLFHNAIRWTAGGRRINEPKPRVGVLHHRGLQRRLAAAGFEAGQIGDGDWVSRIDGFDVLCLGAHDLKDADLPRIKKYVADGHGVIVAGLGWGWLQLNPGRTLDEHPGNRLLAEAGILWADDTLSRTAPDGFAAAEPPGPLTHAARAIDAIVTPGSSPLGPADVVQAVEVAARAARTLPRDDPLLRPRLRRLLEEHDAPIVPDEKRPVDAKTPLDRLVLTLQLVEQRGLAPEQVRAHPAAASFPGAVPQDAPRVTRTVTIDTNVPGRHGTGLYAAPGEVIEVSSSNAAKDLKLTLRIGAHSDSLWHKDAWHRAPEISRTFSLAAPTTKAANAFGGLIYVEVPDGCKAMRLEVTIRNAVEAPRFVLGRTKAAAWRKEIRQMPAPWAELETNKIILTVPADKVCDLDGPTELLNTWDKVMDGCATLAQRPLERARPERIVADRQISAGYMHAGYPIMTHLDAAVPMTDHAQLSAGQWGPFHELGHNHQTPDWTFNGTGEVTCNLFTLYVYETVCGKYEESRPELFEAAREKSIRGHLQAGASFEKWRSDPFLALLMYMQVKEAFGWDLYKKVFAEYRDLPVGERPKSDDDKRDQWLVRLSKAAGRDLGPFFQAWGVPTSDAARASIQDLPDWMPDGFPPSMANADSNGEPPPSE